MKVLLPEQLFLSVGFSWISHFLSSELACSICIKKFVIFIPEITLQNVLAGIFREGTSTCLLLLHRNQEIQCSYIGFRRKWTDKNIYLATVLQGKKKSLITIIELFLRMPQKRWFLAYKYSSSYSNALNEFCKYYFPINIPSWNRI